MESKAFKPIIILTTTDNESDAKRLASVLVEEKLAACVSYHAIDSVYRWQNEIQETKEFQLVAKCNGALTERVTERIKVLHNYDVPEILVLSVSKGDYRYLDWMKTQLL